MDFLDNLENSLKNLETQEERDPNARQRQEGLREQSLAAAPWAKKLKEAPYTKLLFEKAALEGHRRRTKIYMAWLDTVLRLEAKGRWCELRPSPEGIRAEFVSSEGTIVPSTVDLGTDNPEDLLTQWLD